MGPMCEIITPIKVFSGVVTQSVKTAGDVSCGIGEAVFHKVFKKIFVFFSTCSTAVLGCFRGEGDFRY